MTVYRGYEIEQEFGYYTVHYCGDDVIFNTVDAAKKFIDEIWANHNNPNWYI